MDFPVGQKLSWNLIAKSAEQGSKLGQKIVDRCRENDHSAIRQALHSIAVESRQRDTFVYQRGSGAILPAPTTRGPQKLQN